MARNETYFSDWSHLLHTSKAVVAWLERLEARGSDVSTEYISQTVSVAMLRQAIKNVEFSRTEVPHA